MNNVFKGWALAIVGATWMGALIAMGNWVWRFGMVVQTDPEGRRYQDGSFLVAFCVIFVAGIVSILVYISYAGKDRRG